MSLYTSVTSTNNYCSQFAFYSIKTGAHAVKLAMITIFATERERMNNFLKKTRAHEQIVARTRERMNKI